MPHRPNLRQPSCADRDVGAGARLILPTARRAEPHLLTKTPYTRLREAAGPRKWHDSAMKNAVIAFGLFAIGFAILSVIPDADLIPSGVRAVLDDVAAVW